MNTYTQVQGIACNNQLNDELRLEDLHETGQMNSVREAAFDRLTILAAKLLNVPLTLISFISDKDQFFKSSYGLGEPWVSNPVIDIENSVCRYTLNGEILALEDARDHEVLAQNPAISALNLVGYLGIPLKSRNGRCIGALCAVSNEKRKWNDDEINILKELADSVMSEVYLKVNILNLEKEKKNWHQLINFLSHDLRSTVGAANSYAKLIKKSTSDSTVIEYAGSIDRVTKEGISLIEGFLDWKIGDVSSSKSLKMKTFEIHEMLVQLVNDYKNIYDKNNIILLNPDNIKQLKADRNAVLRLIQNLLSNALKYGDDSKDITISIKALENKTSISVHNFGNPIDENLFNKIFESSYRITSANQSFKQGWGIGLALVSKVVKAHDAKIILKSDSQSGTTFEVVFN